MHKISTGLIVVHTHRTLLTVHCLVGDIVEAGIQSEIEVVALAEGVVGSGEEVIAGELVGKATRRWCRWSRRDHPLHEG